TTWGNNLTWLIDSLSPSNTTYIEFDAKVTGCSSCSLISFLIEDNFTGVDGNTSSWSTGDNMVDLGVNQWSLLNHHGKVYAYIDGETNPCPCDHDCDGCGGCNDCNSCHDCDGCHDNDDCNHCNENRTLTHRGTRGLGILEGSEDDEIDSIEGVEKMLISFDVPHKLCGFEIRSLFSGEGCDGEPETGDAKFYMNGAEVGQSHFQGIEEGGNGILIQNVSDVIADKIIFYVGNEEYRLYSEFSLARIWIKDVNVVNVTAYCETTNETIYDSDYADVNVICKQANISIEKQVSRNNLTWMNELAFHSGDTVYWNITVINNGDIDLNNVYVNDTNGNSFGPFNLSAGEVKSFYYTTIASQDNNNTATVEGKYRHGRIHANDSASIHVISAGLSIEKKGNVSIAHAGNIVNYTIYVNNTGNDTLYNVWANDSKLGINKYVGTLAAGESFVFYIEHILGDADPFINEIEAEGYDILGLRYSSNDSFSIDILNPSINVEKYVSDDNSTWSKSITIHSGDNAYWKIVVTNEGDCILYNVTINDGGNNIDIGSIAPNESKTIYWHSSYSSDFTNVVNVSAHDVLGMHVYDESSASIHVIRPSISVTKEVNRSIIHSGDSVTYYVNVTNSGNTNLTNIIVVDDKGLIFTYASGDLNSNGWLDLNEKWVYTNVTTHNSSVTDTVNVSGEDELGKRVYDEASASVVIIGEPHLIINKSDSPDPIAFGNTLTYFITIKNDGDGDAHNVVVVEHYDDDFIFDNATPSPDNGTNNIWSIGTLEAGERFNITIYGQINDNGVTKLE
ncbi:MAG: hypothetical protein J7K95_02245, partial [Thermoplasmata archaeon]|nr:hypothetical protein [Thermoplasmata archaeon]